MDIKERENEGREKDCASDNRIILVTVKTMFDPGQKLNGFIHAVPGNFLIFVA